METRTPTYFPDKSIGEILNVTGKSITSYKKELLAKKLNIIAKTYLVSRFVNSRTTKLAELKKLKRLHLQASKLHKLLVNENEDVQYHILRNTLTDGEDFIDTISSANTRFYEIYRDENYTYITSEDDSPYNYSIDPHELIYNEAINTIGNLEKWIFKALDSLERDLDPHKNNNIFSPQHKGDKSIQLLISKLIEIWHIIFEEIPGTTVGAPTAHNARKADGPFIRFTHKILEIFRANLSDDRIANDPTIISSLTKSHEAIRHLVKRSDTLTWLKERRDSK